MKKAVIFDLYGTLIDIHTDEEKKELWDKMTLFYAYSGAIVNNFKSAYDKAVKEAIDAENHENPDIEILDVFKVLYNEVGVKADRNLLKETASLFRVLSTEYIKLYPGVTELFDLLKKENVRCILLSNAQNAFTRNELKLTGLLTKFDQIYLSSDYKMCKPNPEFYQMMLDKEHLNVDECIYIGNDHTTDIKGANLIGMDSIYLHTNCSQDTLFEFKCSLKIIPGDLYQVIDYFNNLL